jgi:hypothetical protein
MPVSVGLTGTSCRDDRHHMPQIPAPRADDPSVIPQGSVPPAAPVHFAVYAAIANKVLTIADDRRLVDQAAIEDLFERRCAAEGLPYGGDVTRRAVEAAMAARAAAARRVLRSRPLAQTA